MGSLARKMNRTRKYGKKTPPRIAEEATKSSSATQHSGGKLAVAMLATALVLGGCATTGNFCDVAKPIYPAPADVDAISDQLADGVLSHNTYGARACGWK